VNDDQGPELSVSFLDPTDTVLVILGERADALSVPRTIDGTRSDC
jgi:hypothetical protein